MTQGRYLNPSGRGRLGRLLSLGGLAAALAAAVAGCALFGGNDAPPAATTSSLSQLSWCDRPLIEFQDDAQTAQTTIAKWDEVKDQLGFTPYLPASLPKGSCLVVAGGTIHDPIYGGHFSITYDLPTIGPLSFSEAPKRPNLDSSFQCTQSTLGTPPAQGGSATPGAGATPGTQSGVTTICLGVISGTSISMASRQSQSELKSLFGTLQPNVQWVPASAATPTATSTTTSGNATPATTATTSGG